MTLYRRGDVWWYEFVLNGIRVRESSKLKNKDLARKIETARRNAMALGAAGVQRQAPNLMLFNRAAESFLLEREAHWSLKTRKMHSNSLEHLRPHFSKHLVQDIRGSHIAHYQRIRLREGASKRTVNVEVALVRLVLRRHKCWDAISGEVSMLQERQDVGRALSEDEQVRLLAATKASASRSLYPAVLLSIHTGLRLTEMRLLRWRQIDLLERMVQVGKSKTAGGEGRLVPLSEPATDCLRQWRSQFPDAQPGHAVFPRESYGLLGEKGTFGGTVAPYETFPDECVGSWKSAWQRAKKTAQVECRWHDLRHSSVSQVAAGGATDGTLQSIYGWMSPKMITRYSHIQNAAKRQAMATLNRPRKPSRPPTDSPTPKRQVKGGSGLTN